MTVAAAITYHNTIMIHVLCRIIPFPRRVNINYDQAAVSTVPMGHGCVPTISRLCSETGHVFALPHFCAW